MWWWYWYADTTRGGPGQPDVERSQNKPLGFLDFGVYVNSKSKSKCFFFSHTRRVILRTSIGIPIPTITYYVNPNSKKPRGSDSPPLYIRLTWTPRVVSAYQYHHLILRNLQLQKAKRLRAPPSLYQADPDPPGGISIPIPETIDVAYRPPCAVCITARASIAHLLCFLVTYLSVSMIFAPRMSCPAFLQATAASASPAPHSSTAGGHAGGPYSCSICPPETRHDHDRHALERGDKPVSPCRHWAWRPPRSRISRCPDRGPERRPESPLRLAAQKCVR